LQLSILVVAVTLLIGCTNSDDSKVPNIKRYYAPGVREPETVAAGQVVLQGDEMVIGVSVGNRHRAYLVAALVPPSEFLERFGYSKSGQVLLGRHVVNDLIAAVPITVTHCDVDGCMRVFTAGGTASLDLAINGQIDGHMELILYRDRFLQSAENTPLDDFPFVHVTWNEWKADHPDTDLYSGHITVRDIEEEIGSP